MNSVIKAISSHPPKAWIVFGFSLAVTWLAWSISNGFVVERANERFRFETHDLQTAIGNRMRDQEKVLQGGVGLFAASKHVSRDEWRRYADALALRKNYPGLQGFGFAEFIAPEDLRNHTRRIRAAGFPGYSVRPPGPRNIYSSIVYLEPFDWRNKRAFGFDMFSEANRREAMERARDTGNSAMSKVVTLVQETDKDVQRGFLLYLPVYKNNLPLNTVAERRAAVRGYVYSPFRMNDLMTGILGAGHSQIEFELYDGRTVSPENKLYASRKDSVGAQAPNDSDALQINAEIEFAGRTWLARFQTKPGYISSADQSQSTLIAGAGLLLDILIFIVISSISRQHTLVASHARALTIEHRLQAEMNQAIVNAVDPGIVAVDEDGIILSANAAVTRIFGYAPEDLFGKPYSSLLSEDGQILLKRSMQSVGQLTETTHFDESQRLTGLRRDGTIVALEMSITPLDLEDREEFTIVFTELTERQLQNRLKQEFISTVSHELRTPLTSIRGAVGLIASGAVGTIPKSASDLAVVANKNCERMTLIINDILDLEKIEAGRLEIRVRPINVSDFLDQAIDANAPYAGQFDVTFLKQEMDHDLEVAADPDRLMQVLSNLLSNAAKFSHDGGTVTIGAIADVGSVHIFVRDEGIGISDTFKDKIFENFSRADNLDTRHVAGTGLGLSISKKLVEAMHVTINFDSEIGKGATFQIGFRRWTKMSSEPRSRPAGEREETANLGNGQTAQIN